MHVAEQVMVYINAFLEIHCMTTISLLINIPIKCTYTTGTAISIQTDTDISPFVVHTLLSISVTGATVGKTLIYVNGTIFSGPIREASTSTRFIITICGICSNTWTRLIAANSIMCVVTSN